MEVCRFILVTFIFIYSTKALDVCEDKRSWCLGNEDRCDERDWVTYCMKTCEICTDAGCSDGYYEDDSGTRCKPCNNCKDNACNKQDGECINGCKINYRGSRCTKDCPENCDGGCDQKSGKCVNCIANKYGDKCGRSCGQCQNGCDRDTGKCVNCKSNKYGDRCDKHCPQSCKNGCNRDTGQCNGCRNNRYGKKCENYCSNGCRNGCNRDTGICIDGCNNRKYGYFCNVTCPTDCKTGCGETGICRDVKKCPEPHNCKICDNRGCSECNNGWFGDECHHRCPDNCLDECYKYDGKCKQCKDNFVGDFCNGTCNGGCKIVENRRICYKNGKCIEGCNDGMYGKTCNVSCSVSCVGGCHQDNGKCNKCKSGYHGETCEKCNSQCDGGCDQSDGRCYKCESGYHGKTCDKSCSSKCVGGCDQESGTCIKCVDGYYDNTCQTKCSNACKSCERYRGQCTECKEGYWGLYCDNICSSTCSDDCDRSHGQCTECKEGYWGLYCDNICSSTCKPRISSTKPVCHLYNGTCIEGCQPGHTGHNCTTGYPVNMDAQEERGGTVNVVMITTPILCIIAVVVIIGFILYKRKRSERKEGDNEFVENGTCLVAVDPAVVNDATGIYENMREESVYQNVGEVSRSPTRIDLKDLWDYNQDMKEKKFDLEYQDLPKGLCSPHGVCLNEVNKGKNRYKDICAFDHTRVKIDIENGDPNSDYYNACYITGYGRSKRKYIASQGPIATNINDFWRMLWFVEARKIVMLTNLVEMTVVKCLQYWPDLDQTVKYGNISVTMISEEVFAHYVIRTLKVAKDNCETQTLRQYHYTSWPDKGVPTDMTSLLEFHCKVHGMKADLKGPLTVHCSAGIGRTGTFIALDYLMEEGLAEKSVDVNQCVARMRYERVNMVQAKEQYQFLHDIIAEWYFTKDTITTTETFTDSYKNVFKVEKTGGKNGLREIFDMMSKMCIHVKPNMDEFSEAMSESNISKNRETPIVAGSTSPVCLGIPVPGSTDDIAAVYMPSYMTKRAYIVTKTPTTNTVDDFWRMVVESNCQIIVSLDKDQGRNSKNLDQYFSPKAGQYSIHRESEENHSQEFYSKITCNVKSDVNLDQNRKIRIFSCRFWPSKLKVPKSSTPMICLLEDIATLRRASTDGPIVVHCLDGNGKSGVFCTLAAAIERIVQERSVRIIPTINQLRISRHEIITSYEQLKFCFDTIAEYLSNFSEYDIACH